MATTAAPTTTREEIEATEPTTKASAGTASTPVASSAEPSPLPKDHIFGLLSVARRRDVLIYLDENGDETTLSEVAEHIAAEENGIAVSQLTSAQRKRVYIGLYQCHLPKLDDANVIEYNQARGTIELRAEADQLFPHLSLASSDAMTDSSSSDRVESTWLRVLLTKFTDWMVRRDDTA